MLGGDWRNAVLDHGSFRSTSQFTLGECGNVLQLAFTGPIAKGLALVAIVIGGLTFAFGEGGGKRTFAGIIFGLGMAVLAVNFLYWLFGV